MKPSDIATALGFENVPEFSITIPVEERDVTLNDFLEFIGKDPIPGGDRLAIPTMIELDATDPDDLVIKLQLEIQ